jgi:hypothetical protein
MKRFAQALPSAVLMLLAVPRPALADVISGPTVTAVGLGVLACAGLFVLALVVAAVLVLRHLSRRRKAAEAASAKTTDEGAE